MARPVQAQKSVAENSLSNISKLPSQSRVAEKFDKVTLEFHDERLASLLKSAFAWRRPALENSRRSDHR